MHGNIWEWCEDGWHDNYNDALLDGSAWIDGDSNKQHILRGGSWNDMPYYCRSAYRGRFGSDLHDDLIGFRVVYAPARTV
jgi:eukaryotic-like serine/threonine-protein kinase